MLRSSRGAWALAASASPQPSPDDIRPRDGIDFAEPVSSRRALKNERLERQLMRHFAVQRFARLTLYATLAHCVLACSADDDRSPPIGAPTGPIEPPVNQGGAFSGGSGGQLGAIPGAGATNNGPNGGAFNLPGAAGASSFGAS